MEFCPVCGARILPGMTRCESCGAIVSSSPAPNPAQDCAPGEDSRQGVPAAPEAGPGCGQPAVQPAMEGPAGETPGPEGEVPPAAGPKYAPSVREEDGPLSVTACLGTLLLFLIPVVGLVIMFCYSCGQGIPAGRRNLARACLLLTVAFLFLLVLVQLTGILLGGMVQQAVYSSYFGLY